MYRQRRYARDFDVLVSACFREMLRDLVFVHVLKGKHKDREGYIVGETQAFYWVKICGLVRPGSEDRACFAKHNVLQVAHVKNKTWERWAQEDPTSMLAELLEE